MARPGGAVDDVVVAVPKPLPRKTSANPGTFNGLSSRIEEASNCEAKRDGVDVVCSIPNSSAVFDIAGNDVVDDVR